MTLTNRTVIRASPTYIYRGPSMADAYRVDVYACGQIAAGAADPSDCGRAGAWYPHAWSPRAPLFNCPLFTDQYPVSVGNENYAPTHSNLRRGIRNRLTFPLGNRANHYLDETVGFTDGSAQLCAQPDGNGVYWVDYNGNVSTSQASGM